MEAFNVFKLLTQVRQDEPSDGPLLPGLQGQPGQVPRPRGGYHAAPGATT